MKSLKNAAFALAVFASPAMAQDEKPAYTKPTPDITCKSGPFLTCIETGMTAAKNKGESVVVEYDGGFSSGPFFKEISPEGKVSEAKGEFILENLTQIPCDIEEDFDACLKYAFVRAQESERPVIAIFAKGGNPAVNVVTPQGEVYALSPKAPALMN